MSPTLLPCLHLDQAASGDAPEGSSGPPHACCACPGEERFAGAAVANRAMAGEHGYAAGSQKTRVQGDVIRYVAHLAQSAMQIVCMPACSVPACCMLDVICVQ